MTRRETTEMNKEVEVSIEIDKSDCLEELVVEGINICTKTDSGNYANFIVISSPLIYLLMIVNLE